MEKYVDGAPRFGRERPILAELRLGPEIKNCRVTSFCDGNARRRLPIVDPLGSILNKLVAPHKLVALNSSGLVGRQRDGQHAVAAGVGRGRRPVPDVPRREPATGHLGPRGHLETQRPM